ncbi:tripartite motif containing 108 isoform X1 [Megalobrama amblycephala]|uniref:tripartite motif containing 108 isoform X1 n=2 Tax=Megalobrama amblycephala TaxID=75352 RepID=UPI002013D88D|nr:tripartite motif containing 108 isoform X1 [Megalobrama amblycephala]
MYSPLSLQIKCSVCLSDFTDPVTLSCEHSFCRECITGHMQASLGPSACPECQRPYNKEDLKSSRLLRNMTSTVREHLAEQKSDRSTSKEGTQALNSPEMEKMLMCSEHDEKLKLFCETDQKLVCVICRDGDKHKGHVFKPVKEAAQINKGELKTALGFLAKENGQLDYMIQQQTTEITKTEDKSKTLSAQISAQFEEMHQFLQQKEDEVKKQLEKEEKKVIEVMQKNQSLINRRFMENKEMEIILQSALEIEQPDHFLQWWNEKGFPMTKNMKQKATETPSNTQYMSRVKDLSVLPDSLFLGPHETHMQFFVWKEMLQSIKPVPESLTLKNPGESYLKVSPGGARVRQADRMSGLYKDFNPGTVSVENFQTGQHYWEIEVGKKPDWTVGVKMSSEKQTTKSGESEILLHLKHNKGYVLSCDGKDTPLSTRDKPQKIGLYLDCERKQVSFYNADNMSQLVQINYSSKQPCCLSLVPGLYLDGTNSDPLTVCSYEFNSKMRLK